MDVFAVVAILVLLVGAPAIVVNRDLLFVKRRPRRSAPDVPLPFLIVPSHPNWPRIIPAGVGRQRAVASPAVAQQRAPDPLQPEPWVGEDVVEPDVAEPDVVDEETASDATVIFTRPVDEPVQILPGHLQVLSGDDSGEDLHLFSKLGETPRILVGREKGPAHRHITLHSPTVSRRHARMEFVNGSWTITNLSATNPILVNDRVLKNGTSARKLSDGDRIELGEVALRFLAS